jgi:aldehyde:ferredoxin oxidoreductase
MHAAHGVIYDVDLETRTVKRLELDPDDYRKYAGGSGLAAALMMRDQDPALIDPLGRENDLWFLVGTLVSTGAPATPKLLVCARSPLTGIWGEAAGGGHFPAQLKMAGVDGLVLRGKSETPVYLTVDEGGCAIQPADDLWGLDTFDTHDELLARHGKRGKAACIGPAGEAGVRFAAVMVDGSEARAAGRCGMGTVMGAKKVKAIYAQGGRKPTLHDPAGLKAALKEHRKVLLANTKGLTDWSTAGGVEAVEFHGDLPVKNWQLGAWKAGAQAIGAQAWFPKYLKSHGTCNLCPIRCHKLPEVPDGDFASPKCHGPEYETIAGFGSNLLIDQPEPIIKANEIANRLGYDTISGAGVIAFGFEAFEKGLIDLDDTGGLALEWGSGEALVGLARQIGHRDTAAGRLLGEGSRRAAEALGGGSEKWTIEVKGLELPLHDPRAHVSMAPNYATSVRGACHLDALTYFVGRGVPAAYLGHTEPFTDHVSSPEMGKLCYLAQNYQSMFNPLGLCKFLFVGQVGPDRLAEWIRLATGWDMDADEYMETGERILQLKRLYNARVGVRREDDTLPYRLLHEPQPDGKAGGVVPDLPVMLDELYRLRGWADDGVPTPETVAKFGLGEFVGDE